MKAVTTFPSWAWDVYAEHCIRTWLDCWPDSILVYYEGDAPPLEATGVEFRPLSEAEGRKEFLQSPLGPHPDSYLFDAKRFCHKVFAQLEVMKDGEPFFWIDADVEMLQPVPDTELKEVMGKDFVCFLGRNTYTEAGFIGFNTNHPDFDEFRKTYRSCYGPERVLFNLYYWTDCHAFDYARNGGGYNMTPEGRGVENVMAKSWLAPYMKHHKGNLKLELRSENEPH